MDGPIPAGGKQLLLLVRTTQYPVFAFTSWLIEEVKKRGQQLREKGDDATFSFTRAYFPWETDRTGYLTPTSLCGCSGPAYTCCTHWPCRQGSRCDDTNNGGSTANCPDNCILGLPFLSYTDYVHSIESFRIN